MTRTTTPQGAFEARSAPGTVHGRLAVRRGLDYHHRLGNVADKMPRRKERR